MEDSVKSLDVFTGGLFVGRDGREMSKRDDIRHVTPRAGAGGPVSERCGPGRLQSLAVRRAVVSS